MFTFQTSNHRQISEETVASWAFLLMKDALPCVSTCNHTTDKMHFVPKCNAFLFIRKKYLDPRFWEGPILFKFMFTLILVLYKLNFVYFYLRFVNRIALLEYFNFFFASLEFILYLWHCTNKCEYIDVHWWCAWRKLKEVILLSFMIIVTGLPKT